MAVTGKVALLLLGILVGGVFAYVTRQPDAGLQPGATAGDLEAGSAAADHGDSVTMTQFQRIVIYAFAGGLTGLVVSFAVDRRN